MRGKALYGVFEGLVGGITPAHAGKSFGLVIKFLRHGDHPRTCGEKPWPFLTLSMALGSPPHMRGKDVKEAIKIMMKRITPAHAGKSYESVPTLSQEWDHPRTCGEKRKRFRDSVVFLGSPPHMRGKD